MKRKKILDIDAYPLQWPDGWTRTKPGKRKRSRYQVSFGKARNNVVDEVRLLDADDVVVSTDVPTNRSGLPYANHSEPDDPGVAVYWIKDGQPQVIACDAWHTVRENMRAVGYAIAGLRQIERTGATEILTRAYAGFSALPPANGKSWRQALGFDEHEPVTRQQIRDRRRELVMQHHPDRGGDEAKMAEINAAVTEALEEAQP